MDENGDTGQGIATARHARHTRYNVDFIYEFPERPGTTYGCRGLNLGASGLARNFNRAVCSRAAKPSPATSC
jgi:hypothetical protein